MGIPNINQRLYLAKALNEDTDNLFDHPEQLNESYTQRKQYGRKPPTPDQAAARKEAAAKWVAEREKTHKLVDSPSGKKKIWVPKDQTNEETLAEAVTRKHFQQVADVIKAHPDPKKRAELAAHHAEIFKKQNPRFDHERFFRAANAEKLNEATRSKYLKAIGQHTVGSDESKLNLARLKRDMAILQRGGADAETMKGAAAARGRYDRNEKPDKSYNPHDTVMAGYRFATKASRSKEAGKKSPRTVKEAVVSKKADKIFRKFGFSPEYRKAELKRQIDVLRRGGASDETIRSFPAIHARGGYHNKADITTARENFMSRGIRKHLKRLGSLKRLGPPRKSTNEEIISEGVRRMRRLRAARHKPSLWGGSHKQLDATYDKELAKVSASRLLRGGASKSTIRGFFKDQPTTKAADKAYERFSRNAMNKANAKGKKIFEGSRGQARLQRMIKSVKKNADQAKKMVGPMPDSYRVMTATNAPDVQAYVGGLGAAVAHMRKKNGLRKQIGDRTKAAAMRERGRAGMNPAIPSGSSLSVWQSNPAEHPYKENPKRVPKSLKNYRAASAKKKTLGLQSK